MTQRYNLTFTFNSVFSDTYECTPIPICSLSDYRLGSMRNVWADGQNITRRDYFEKNFPHKRLINIELCHSKKIVLVQSSTDIDKIENDKTLADGILCTNTDFVPAVTVADCMPIFVYTEKPTLVFGVLHSGWKGTGITQGAIEILQNEFGCAVKDIHFLLGPHIRDCCYTVDKERAEYFTKNFSIDCVTPCTDSKQYALSLEKANIALLLKYGIPRENITTQNLCTCCAKDEKGKPIYASFRREIGIEKREKFRAMLACISMEKKANI